MESRSSKCRLTTPPNQPRHPISCTALDREAPKDRDLHLIADNYATHKHPKVKAWLERHPRFKMQFTPTSSSWLNLVECFFADLTEDVIRSGSFMSLNELVCDIKAYLAQRNAAPKPYTWKAEGAENPRQDQTRRRCPRGPRQGGYVKIFESRDTRMRSPEILLHSLAVSISTILRNSLDNWPGSLSQNLSARLR